jgi:NADP-dependent 3-hydroxy acid dehydrogenase YdfG
MENNIENRAIAFATEQPADVYINEIVIRSAAQDLTKKFFRNK